MFKFKELGNVFILTISPILFHFSCTEFVYGKILCLNSPISSIKAGINRPLGENKVILIGLELLLLKSNPVPLKTKIRHSNTGRKKGQGKDRKCTFYLTYL